jgi:hypothetical protein
MYLNTDKQPIFVVQEQTIYLSTILSSIMDRYVKYVKYVVKYELEMVYRLNPRYIEVIKKVLPSCVLFFARLGNTSETGQNNNNSS